MAAAVDGLLWRTESEDGAPRTDGDDDGAPRLEATDREGNLLLPLKTLPFCNRGVLCPNSITRRVRSPFCR